MNGIPEKEINKIWNTVFNLALNFLHNESAAEDATQEIFLKAQKKLPSFRNESKPGTWIYRIAYNYLIDLKRRPLREEISFDLFEQDVQTYKPFENSLHLTEQELRIYVEQIKIGCTKAMLQCLDSTDRLVFILGNLFQFSGRDSACICNMSEPTFRKRLSRATGKITSFMNLNCGLVNPNATCQCRKRIGVALERDRINPDMLLHHISSKKIKEYLAAMNAVDAVATIFRDNPYIEKKDLFTPDIQQAVDNLAQALISSASLTQSRSDRRE